MRRTLGVPDVLRYDVTHPRDLGQLVADVGDRQVEVLGTYEEDVVGLTLPYGLQQARDELEQASGLLELLVLLEERDDVLEARVERVRGSDLVGDRLGAPLSRVSLGRLGELPPVGTGDRVDLGLVRQALEQPLTQDVVDLVGGEVDWRDAALLATQFGASVGQRPVDELATRVVGRSQVGDDDAHVALLARRREQVREGTRRDVGHGAVAYLLSV